MASSDQIKKAKKTSSKKEATPSNVEAKGATKKAKVAKKRATKKTVKSETTLERMIAESSMHPKLKEQKVFVNPHLNEERYNSIEVKQSQLYKKVETRKKESITDRYAYQTPYRGFYHDQSKALPKRKHVLSTLIVLATLIIIANYFSPKSNAESAVFYPTSCLGGWVNPKNAEGAPQVEGNAEKEKFTAENSAVLSSGTIADIYCGGFAGTFAKNTKPTKIIVALSWSKGVDLATTTNVVSSSFEKGAMEILDSNASTTVTFTLATTTSPEATSTNLVSTTTVATSTDDIQASSTIKTDTLEVKPQAFDTLPVATTTEEAKPLSFLNFLFNTVILSKADKTYADEIAPQVTNSDSVPQTGEAPAAATSDAAQTINDFLKKADDVITQKIDLPNIASSSPNPVQSNLTEDATSSAEALLNDQSVKTINATSAVENNSQVNNPVVESSINQTEKTHNEDDTMSNFLEVLYTFDGVTWSSLGKVNEDSLVYRTFEIPITSTTSWDDLSQLQIKVTAIGRLDPTPTIYLDGMKAEVLYDTPVLHEHPDFVRDTILRDITENSVRVVNLINNDTNNKEIWYTAPGGEGGLAVASSSWLKVDAGDDASSYKFLELYEKHLFWVDDSMKKVWTADLDKNTTDSVMLNIDSTTTIPFLRTNGENWALDYNSKTKQSLLHIRIIPENVRTFTVLRLEGKVKAKKIYSGSENESLSITVPYDGSIGTYLNSGASLGYTAISQSPSIFSLDGFGSGIYTFVYTTRADGCSTYSLDECRFDSSYQGEVQVLVNVSQETNSAILKISTSTNSTSTNSE